ncbi:MAG TPA: hypothetical protein VGI60_10260 [Chthoniobacterales bacterium]|jgi:hypothetical protein
MFERFTSGLGIAAKTVVLLIGASAPLLLAQDEPTPGLDALPEVAFSALSSSDRNPLGAQALALHPEEWKHAETEHFIYHFIHSYVATPISVESEFYFRVISEELGKEVASGTPAKAHIYIFEKPEDWKRFQVAGHLEPWTGGIHSGGSLFIQRNPEYKFGNNSLGHEIAHLVLYRFYQRTVPLWLNEGFAEYISRISRASYERARDYNAHARSPSVPSDQIIPLAQLTGMTGYPGDNTVHAFYRESERLVRFLISTDREAFLGLLNALARGDTFGTALSYNYGSRFFDIAALEEEFFPYATLNAKSPATPN